LQPDNPIDNSIDPRTRITQQLAGRIPNRLSELLTLFKGLASVLLCARSCLGRRVGDLGGGFLRGIGPDGAGCVEGSMKAWDTQL
jgi:hypothetical protein